MGKWTLRIGRVLVATAIASACGDPSAGSPPVDAAMDGATDTVASALVGRAWIGAPVRGARVEVFAYDDLVRGTTFGETMTNVDGRFGMPMPDFEGRIVIRVSGAGATMVSPVTGATESFGESDELFATVILGPGLAGRELQVDLLTTLSTTYALSLRESEGPERGMSLAVERFAQHVHPDVFDATEVPRGGGGALVWPTPEAAVTLFHMGMHEVWADLIEASGAPRPGVGTAVSEGALGFIAFARALRRDVRDGVFDGLEFSTPAWSGGIDLDAEATRARLAVATKRWNDAQDGWTGLTTADLTGADGFCTLVSTDTGPLYPAGTPGAGGAYDPVPPSLAFEPPSPDASAALRSDFVVRGRVTDAGGLVAITLSGVTLANPPEVDLAAGIIEAEVSTDLNPDGEYTLSLSATDRSGNSAHVERVVRVDTTGPTLDVAVDGALDVAGLLVPTNALRIEGDASDAGSGLAVVSVGPEGGDLEAIPIVSGHFAYEAELTAGPHRFHVEATDVAGNATLETIELAVDVTGPTLTVLEPLPGGLVGPGPTAVVVDAIDPSGVTLVEVRGVGGVWTAAELLPDGHHVAPIAPPLVDGSFVFDVRGRDAAGHERLVTGNAVRDGTPPIIGDIEVLGVAKAPGAAGFWTAAAEVGVRVKVDDLHGVASVEVAGHPAAPNGASWQALIPVEVEALTPVLVLARDSVANEVATTIAVGRDLTAPACVLNPPPGGEWTSETSLVLGGVADDAGVGSVTVAIEGGLSAAPALVVGGAFQGTVLLPNGDVELRAQCTDALGNDTTSTPVTVRVDRKAPLVALSPPDGAHLNTNDLELLVAVTEHSGVAQVELRSDANTELPAGEFVAAELLATGDAETDWIFRGVLPLAELDGAIEVEYRVVDLAGNVTVGQVHYEKDASAPVFGPIDVVGSSVRDGVYYVRDAFATVRVALLDAPSSVGGVTVGGLPTALSAGFYQAFVDLSGATEPVAVPLSASDLAGNTRTLWITVARDTSPPTCALAPPAQGGYTQASAIPLAVTTADLGVGGVTVRVVVGGEVGPSTPAGDGELAVDAGPLPEGDTVVSVICQDALGNSASSPAVLVTRDLDPPVITDCVPPTGAVLGGGAFELSCRFDDIDPGVEVDVLAEAPTGIVAGEPLVASLYGGRYRVAVPGFGAWMSVGGPGRLRVRARDRAGGEAEQPVDYAVDLEAPTFTTLSASPGVVLPSGETAVRSGLVAISVVAADVPAGVHVVRVGRLGQGAPLAVDAATFQGGAYVASRDVVVPGGDVVVTAEDTVGNHVDTILTLRADDAGPSCTLSALPGGGWTSQSVVSLAFETLDGVAGGAVGVPYRAGLPAGAAVAGPSASVTVAGLVEGENELWVRCTDALGNSTESEHVVVTRDSTPPTVQIVSPFDGAYVSAAGGVLVAEVEDAGEVTVTVRSQGAEPVAAAFLSGRWTAAFPVPLQADGPFWVDVIATDAVGNQSVTRLTLRRDGMAPALGVPEVAGSVLLGETYWVRGPLALVRLPVSDTGAGVASVIIGGKPAALLAGSFEASVPVTAEPQGVVFTATDAVGNAATGQILLRADADPPTCELEKAGGGKVWRKTAGPYAAYVKSLDGGVGSGGVDVVADGVVAGAEQATFAPGVLVPDLYVGWQSVIGPSHTLSAVCRDLLGNTSSSAVLELGLDAVPPVVTGMVPAPGAFVRSGPLVVSATASDALSGVSAIKVVGGGASIVNVAGPPFASPFQAAFTIPKGVSTYVVAYYVDDAAGNSVVQGSSYTIDDTPPTLVTATTIAGATVLGGVRWVPSTTAVLTARVHDPAGVKQVHFGTVLATLKVDHDGVVTATATVTGIPTDGPKSYDLKATDLLDNTKILEPVSLRADVTPPTCVLLDPLDDHWTNDPLQLAHIDSKDAGIGQLTVTLDGGVDSGLKAILQNGLYSAIVTLSGAEVDSVQATCVDGVGNVAQSPVVLVHFDDVAPVIVILPTTTKDYSGTTVNMMLNPPTISGTPSSVSLSESSCSANGGCPSFSIWSHLAAPELDTPVNTDQVPYLAVAVSDDRGAFEALYETANSSGATILGPSQLVSGKSDGLSVVGVPLVPAFLTDVAVVTMQKWARSIRLTAVDRAGNTAARIVPIQVQLLASPMKTTLVVGNAAPDLAGLGTAGAVASVFSTSLPLPWSTFGGVRVLHLEVENPYNVELPVRFELAGTVRVTRDVARRLPTTTTVESCFTQTCVPGQCRVGTSCVAVGLTAVPRAELLGRDPVAAQADLRRGLPHPCTDGRRDLDSGEVQAIPVRHGQHGGILFRPASAGLWYEDRVPGPAARLDVRRSSEAHSAWSPMPLRPFPLSEPQGRPPRAHRARTHRRLAERGDGERGLARAGRRGDTLHQRADRSVDFPRHSVRLEPQRSSVRTAMGRYGTTWALLMIAGACGGSASTSVVPASEVPFDATTTTRQGDNVQAFGQALDEAIESTDAQLAAVLARLDALEAERDALAARATALESANVALSARVLALEEAPPPTVDVLGIAVSGPLLPEGTLRSTLEALHASIGDLAGVPDVQEQLDGRLDAVEGAVADLSACPEGTTAVGEFCVESTPRSPDLWENAVTHCGGSGGHVCDANEYSFACQHPTALAGGDGLPQLTSELVTDSDGTFGVAILYSGGTCAFAGKPVDANGTHPYRCCYHRVVPGAGPPVPPN